MQARAVLDVLLQSGVLEDVGGDTDEIQKELDDAGTAAEVDNELAGLKAEIGQATPRRQSDRRLSQKRAWTRQHPAFRSVRARRSLLLKSASPSDTTVQAIVPLQTLAASTTTGYR